MRTGIYVDSFSKVFSKLLEKTRITCYQISQYSHLDQAYLSRLKSGEMSNPGIETLMKISLALVHFSDKVTFYDIESLFNSVGRSLLIKSNPVGRSRYQINN